jgi:hypothetical protein
MKKSVFLITTFLLLNTNLGFTKDKIATLEKKTGKEVYQCTLGAENDDVIVGDENSAIFKPKIKFNKWNSENSLSFIVPDGLITDKTVRVKDTQKIEIGDSKTGFYFNRFDDKSFKFGLILFEKPSTNTWSFQLEGWQDFSFLYQQPLKNENPDGSRWQYFDEKKQKGMLNQPADVSGGWAVYHKTKRDYIIGQINYGCGKVFSIYRPKFIDADGKMIWADILIKDGIYTVTVDQTFLDDAIYPVKANDTVGYTSVGDNVAGSQDTWIGNYYAFSPAGTASVLKAACRDAGADHHTKFAMWAGTSSVPGALLNNSSTGALLVTQTTKPTQDSQWTAGNITASIGATSYWLALNTENDSVEFYYDGDITAELYVGGDQYSGFPTNPAPTVGLYDNLRVSMYVIYAAGGGEAVYSGRGIGRGTGRGIGR